MSECEWIRFFEQSGFFQWNLDFSSETRNMYSKNNLFITLSFVWLMRNWTSELLKEAKISKQNSMKMKWALRPSKIFEQTLMRLQRRLCVLGNKLIYSNMVYGLHFVMVHPVIWKTFVKKTCTYLIPDFSVYFLLFPYPKILWLFFSSH